MLLYGNKAESSYKVTVKTKPQEPVAQQPSYQTSNQSSGNSGYSNNQGSAASNSKPVSNNSGSSNQTAQSKPQKECKVEPSKVTGNSGKIFNSEKEAIDYGNKMSYEDSSIVSFAYIQIMDNCDNLLNQWTVEFNYGNDIYVP